MKRALYAAGRVLSVAALAFLAWRLAGEWERLPPLTPGPAAWAAIGVSTALVAATVPLAAWIWKLLLDGGGAPLAFRNAFGILAISQLWRYLPGIFLHQLGQVAMARRAGLPLNAAALTVGVQSGLNVGVNAAVALAGLWLDPRLWPRVGFWLAGGTAWLAALGAALAVAAATVLPPVRRWVRPRLAFLRPRALVPAAALYLAINVVYGLVLSLLLRTVWSGAPRLAWYDFAWGYALAWMAGFLVPGAPAGLGVREAALVELYQGRVGAGVIIGLALLLRALIMIGDALAAGLAVLLSRRTAKDRPSRSGG